MDYDQKVRYQTKIKYNYILKLTNGFNVLNTDQQCEPI